ncbi:unnamed protein product [Vitrella brassicaformis CCMP3155]|uniref:Uncharacterized protein n=2 Tax=Vitrella brassicaformis TaxID=1169539 RepID=A0A0G4GIV7_VITBC|nr:unnamed protein product [Vitrella brassicaformis CCMP3155]|eukprot:CEM29662.1 unnamed protein product [Vitrella brassicaformis CCMP3155]
MSEARKRATRRPRESLHFSLKPFKALRGVKRHENDAPKETPSAEPRQHLCHVHRHGTRDRKEGSEEKSSGDAAGLPILPLRFEEALDQFLSAREDVYLPSRNSPTSRSSTDNGFRCTLSDLFDLESPITQKAQGDNDEPEGRVKPMSNLFEDESDMGDDREGEGKPAADKRRRKRRPQPPQRESWQEILCYNPRQYHELVICVTGVLGRDIFAAKHLTFDQFRQCFETAYGELQDMNFQIRRWRMRSFLVKPYTAIPTPCRPKHRPVLPARRLSRRPQPLEGDQSPVVDSARSASSCAREKRAGRGRRVSPSLQQRRKKPAIRLVVFLGGKDMLALDWLEFLAIHYEAKRRRGEGSPGGRKRERTALLLVDYPGYGVCEGSPNVETLCETAIAAIREGLSWLRGRHPSSPLKLHLLGYSLGTSVALKTATSILRDPSTVIPPTPPVPLASLSSFLDCPCIHAIPRPTIPPIDLFAAERDARKEDGEGETCSADGADDCPGGAPALLSCGGSSRLSRLSDSVFLDAPEVIDPFTPSRMADVESRVDAICGNNFDFLEVLSLPSEDATPPCLSMPAFPNSPNTANGAAVKQIEVTASTSVSSAFSTPLVDTPESQTREGPRRSSSAASQLPPLPDFHLEGLSLMAPFTNTEAMATELLRSVGLWGPPQLMAFFLKGLVAPSVKWDNLSALKDLIELQLGGQPSPACCKPPSLTVSIVHGSDDALTPPAMGEQLANVAHRCVREGRLKHAAHVLVSNDSGKSIRQILGEQKRKMIPDVQIHYSTVEGADHGSILVTERHVLEVLKHVRLD